MFVEKLITYNNITFQNIAMVSEKFCLGRRTIVVARNYWKPEFIVNNLIIGAMDIKPAFEVPRCTRFSSSNGSDDGDCFEPM